MQSTTRQALKEIDVTLILSILRHVESQSRAIKLYRKMSPDFFYFTPPSISETPRNCYLQPQIVNGIACIVANYPNRTKTLKLSNGDFKMSPNDPINCERNATIFLYDDCPLIKQEILDRLKRHPDYQTLNPKIHAFSDDLDCKSRAVKSFVYVIWLAILFMEGQYRIETALSSLKNKKFPTVLSDVLKRLNALINVKWIPESPGPPAKKRQKRPAGAASQARIAKAPKIDKPKPNKKK